MAETDSDDQQASGVTRRIDSDAHERLGGSAGIDLIESGGGNCAVDAGDR